METGTNDLWEDIDVVLSYLSANADLLPLEIPEDLGEIAGDIPKQVQCNPDTTQARDVANATSLARKDMNERDENLHVFHQSENPSHDYFGEVNVHDVFYRLENSSHIYCGAEAAPATAMDDALHHVDNSCCRYCGEVLNAPNMEDIVQHAENPRYEYSRETAKATNMEYVVHQVENPRYEYSREAANATNMDDVVQHVENPRYEYSRDAANATNMEDVAQQVENARYEYSREAANATNIFHMEDVVQHVENPRYEYSREAANATNMEDVVQQVENPRYEYSREAANATNMDDVFHNDENSCNRYSGEVFDAINMEEVLYHAENSSNRYSGEVFDAINMEEVLYHVENSSNRYSGEVLSATEDVLYHVENPFNRYSAEIVNVTNTADDLHHSEDSIILRTASPDFETGMMTIKMVDSMSSPEPPKERIQESRSLSRRGRHSKEDLSIMRNSFNQHSAYPSEMELYKLSTVTKLKIKQIKTWFKNEREKLERTASTGDGVSLKNKYSHPDSSVKVLRVWLNNHLDNPKPTDLEKELLAKEARLTKQQVSNWFGNKRKQEKLKKTICNDGL